MKAFYKLNDLFALLFKSICNQKNQLQIRRKIKNQNSKLCSKWISKIQIKKSNSWQFNLSAKKKYIFIKKMKPSKITSHSFILKINSNKFHSYITIQNQKIKPQLNFNNCKLSKIREARQNQKIEPHEKSIVRDQILYEDDEWCGKTEVVEEKKGWRLPCDYVR